jgi:hypothetical protein
MLVCPWCPLLCFQLCRRHPTDYVPLQRLQPSTPLKHGILTVSQCLSALKPWALFIFLWLFCGGWTMRFGCSLAQGERKKDMVGFQASSSNLEKTVHPPTEGVVNPASIIVDLSTLTLIFKWYPILPLLQDAQL